MTRRVLRQAVVAALLAAAAGAGAQDRADLPRPGSGASWAVRVPSAERVAFQGVVSFDAAGFGAAPILYVAPTPALALVQVLAHGLFSEGAKQVQKNRLQADADGVLAPYEPVLSSLTHERLLRDALAKQRTGNARRMLAAADPGSNDDWWIEMAPVFSMTADQRALVLDNAVRVYAPGSDRAAYAQTIRVVSRPVALPPADAASAPGAQLYWLADQGRPLGDESAVLLAESLDAAITDVAAPPPADAPAHRTFRYWQGGSEKMERGALVQADCDRLLIRTLRGGLMSVPVKAGAASPGCAATASK